MRTLIEIKNFFRSHYFYSNLLQVRVIRGGVCFHYLLPSQSSLEPKKASFSCMGLVVFWIVIFKVIMIYGLGIVN